MALGFGFLENDAKGLRGAHSLALQGPSIPCSLGLCDQGQDAPKKHTSSRYQLFLS